MLLARTLCRLLTYAHWTATSGDLLVVAFASVAPCIAAGLGRCAQGTSYHGDARALVLREVTRSRGKKELRKKVQAIWLGYLLNSAMGRQLSLPQGLAMTRELAWKVSKATSFDTCGATSMPEAQSLFLLGGPPPSLLHQAPTAAPCHRLDKGTSGIVVRTFRDFSVLDDSLFCSGLLPPRPPSLLRLAPS